MRRCATLTRASQPEQVYKASASVWVIYQSKWKRQTAVSSVTLCCRPWTMSRRQYHYAESNSWVRLQAGWHYSWRGVERGQKLSPACQGLIWNSRPPALRVQSVDNVQTTVALCRIQPLSEAASRLTLLIGRSWERTEIEPRLPRAHM